MEKNDHPLLLKLIEHEIFLPFNAL